MKKLIPVLFIVFVGFLAYAMVIPIFTVLAIDTSFFSRKEHIQVLFLGLALTMYPIGQFLGAPVLGAISDRFGRKPVLVFTLFIATICYLLISLAIGANFVALLLCALFIAGVCESNIAIAQGMVSDISTKGQRAERFGYIFAATSTAYIIGPLIAGSLSKVVGHDYIAYIAPFLFISALLLLTLLLTIFSVAETHTEEKRKHVPLFAAFTNFKYIFTDSILRPFFFFNFFAGFVAFGFFRTFPLYMAKLHTLNVSQLSDYVAIGAVPILITNSLLIRPISKLFKPLHVIALANIAMGLSLIGFLAFTNVVLMIVFIIIFCTGFALSGTLMSGVISHLADPSQQGRVMGNNASMMLASQALSVILGQFTAAFNLKLPFIIFTVIALINGLAIIRTNRKKRPH